MRWMAWTTPSAVFFIVIIGAILGLLVWELISPTKERKGFLPMPTTRGDRFFIGLLASAFVHMGWLALTTMTPWIALAISAALMLGIGVWG
jgi:predicted small integral membrane protein